MPRFFVEHVEGETIHITGEDARHIGKALRMVHGESLVVCDSSTDTEYFCTIEQVGPDLVTAAIDHAQHSAAEPDVSVHLYQAMPKNDKMEWIIQKAVELGVTEITPVLTRRCVSRPDAKSLAKKSERWQKIAEEAAKQSGRGKIPQIHNALDYSATLPQIAQAECAVLFYELGGKPLREHLQSKPKTMSIVIGAEGGFDEEEVAVATAKGIGIATLGKRILRCETAPLCALSAIMYETGNLD